MPRLFHLLCACLALAWLLAGPWGRATAAERVIENRAGMSYLDTASGLHGRLDSNTVRVGVPAAAALSLSAGQTLRRAPGTGFALAHRLRNGGAAPARLRLDFAAPAASGTRLLLDANGNGRADPGEAELDAGATLTLAAGEQLDLLLLGSVPGEAAPGDRFDLTLGAAVDGAPAAVVSAADAVIVSAGPALRVKKSASAASAAPGELLGFRIVASNHGAGPARGVPVQVDGALRRLVLLTDALPANTRLDRVEAASDSALGFALYHLRGQPEGSYTRRLPADAASVDAVAWAVDGLDAGQTVAFELTLRVADNAAGAVENLAAARFSGADDDGLDAVEDSRSNTVRVALPARAPTLDFFRDAAFRVPASAAAVGATLYVQADAAGCNLDPSLAEQVQLTLRSTLTDDEESFIAEEVADNRGVFRIRGGVPTVAAGNGTVRRGDGRLALRADDRIVARLAGCGSAHSEAAVLIDPYGVVFDSKSNAPLAGATVSLIDASGAGNGGKPGGPAMVFAADGLTPAPSTVSTGADGRYAFPRVAAGDYRLQVVPPPGYVFPSVLPLALMPGDRAVLADASWGRVFPVDAATGAVHADLPLDAPPGQGLFVRKQAGRERVEIGDFLDYTVEIRNVSGVAQGGVRLSDTLPAGFAFVAGSVRRDGARGADPVVTGGAGLSFELGSLAAEASTRLAYRVRVTALAPTGSATNRARAGSAPPLAASSNVATATVQVDAGVFASRGFLLGRVFLDCDGDGLPGDGEPGVSGARLILETGDTVVADSQGRYHFDDLLPVSHVLRLDPASLPAVLAAQAGSRFVDMKNGELRRADFALRPAGACAAAASSVAASPSIATPPVSAGAAAASVGVSASAPGEPPASASLEALMPTLSAEPAFLLPAAGALLAAAQTAVRVQGPAGARLSLRVNGVAVAAQRLGSRVVDPGRGVQALEFVGVKLRPGVNRLQLEVGGDAGRRLAGRELSVTVAGPLARLLVSAEGEAVADGRSPARLRVRLLDDAGVAVAARTALTLESSLGRWRVADLDPATPGVQTFVEGGEALLELTPPDSPGEARVRITAGSVAGELRLAYAPALRPLVAVGVVEGVLDFSRLGRGLVPATAADGFERELRRFGGEALGGRAALFLKGKISGDTLLTLAYDSEKPAQDPLFRDLEPERYYPVYGDEATRSFDAQSTEKLYVRVDRGQSWALYGDFTTAPAGIADGRPGSGPALARYSRSLTGVKARHEGGAIKAEVFAAHGRSRLIVEELAGNGTSGPYRLRAIDLVPGSEKVELLVRDRNQPALIVSTTPLARFSDYELDDGRVLLRRPLASLDADLNPQSLRISYESGQGGEAFWVSGGDVELQVAAGLTLGASLADDRNPRDAYRLAGVRARWQPDAATTVAAEVADSRRESLGSGRAARVELDHQAGPLSVKASAGRAGADFDNPAAPLGRGREEARLSAAYVVDPETRLTAEAIHSSDLASGGRRDGARLSLERDLGDGLRLETGLRLAREANAPAQPGSPGGVDLASLRARLSAALPALPGASVYGEAEQAVSGSGKLFAVGGEYRFAVGGDRQFPARGRLYARHEFANTLGGFYGLNESQRRQATVLGIDSEFMADGHVFSEYRGRDAVDGRAPEAAIGLRNLWPVAPGLRLSTGFERVAALGGGSAGQAAASNESTAVTGGLEWTPRPGLKTTARLEWRTATASASRLATVGLVWKLDAAWSLLGKGSFDLSEPRGSVATQRQRLQAGVAHRGAQWLALARYGWQAEAGPAGERAAHLLSLHANFQPDRRSEWTLRHAVKWRREAADDIVSHGLAQLVALHWRRQLGGRWDIGLGATLTADDGFARRRAGLSAEAGYRVGDDLWLAAGYNALALRDAELGGELPGRRGFFLRLRFKFDESALAGMFGGS